MDENRKREEMEKLLLDAEVRKSNQEAKRGKRKQKGNSTVILKKKRMNQE